MRKTAFGLVDNVSRVLATRFMGMGIRLCIGVLIARTLGPAGKGIFFLIFLLPEMFAIFGNLSIGPAAIYYMGKEREKGPEIFSAMTIFLIGSSFIISLSYAFLLPCLSESFFKGVPYHYLQTAIIIVPFLIISDYTLHVVRGSGKFNVFNGMVIGNRVLLLIVLLFVLHFFNLGINGAVYGYIGSAILFGALCMIIAWSVMGGVFRFSKKIFFDLFIYGIANHVTLIMIQLENRIDILIVNYFLNPEQVGLYTVSVVFAQLIWHFSSSVGAVFFPKIVHMSKTDAMELTPKVCRNTFALCLLIGFIALVTGYPLIKYIYGEPFLPAYLPFVLLLPGTVIHSLYRVLANYFRGTGRPALISKITAVSLIINILLNILLVPLLGITGASISSTISYTISAIIAIRIYVNESGSTISDIILIGRSDFEIYYRYITVMVHGSRFKGSKVKER